MKLIVGLGNPGREYEKNRHNIGFMCLNHFARTHNMRFDKKQGKARIGVGEVAGSKVMVARPQTYMNLSGAAVSLLANKFNVGLDNLLVVHDDLDLPLGKIRIRQNGGSAGHKGVKSVIIEMGSQNFARLRVGIGRPTIAEGSPETMEGAIIDYVLNDFTVEESQVITQVIPRVSEAILCFITEGLMAAMNEYN